MGCPSSRLICETWVCQTWELRPRSRAGYRIPRLCPSRHIRSHGPRRQRLARCRMRAHLRHKLRHRTRLHQRRAYRVANKIMHHALLPETYLGLRGMHIHVYLARRQLQKQQHHRIHRRRNNIPVSLGQRVLQQPVANRAPIHKHKNRIAIQLLNLRLRDKSMNPHLPRIWCWERFAVFIGFPAPPRRRLRQSHALQRLPRRHGNQLIQRFFAEDLIHALAVSRHRRRHQHGIRRRVQLKMLLRMRQRILRDQRRDVRQLGRLRLQKFLARRSIKKKIAHRNRSSQRQPRFFHARNLPAVDLDDRARRFFFRPSLQPQPRHRRDRRQRLPAKSQRSHAQQVFGVLDLRSRMPLKRQHGIVAHHAATVVGNLDQLLPAGLHADLNSRCARVERVLQHLLHHRRRPLHHLARGDLVGNSLGEYVDASHGKVDSDQWPVSQMRWEKQRSGWTGPV